MSGGTAPGACTRRAKTRCASCATFSMTTGRPVSNGCATRPSPPNDTKEPLMAELIREIVIDATPETIWPFLTEADKHVEWVGTVAEIDPRPGGIYRVLVGGQHQSAGEVVEVVPNQKVVFTFGWEEKDHPIPPGSTTVEITLHSEGDKTRVRLVHRGLPADAVEDHGEGWAHSLERLAVTATGGDAGPDSAGSGS